MSHSDENCCCGNVNLSHCDYQQEFQSCVKKFTIKKKKKATQKTQETEKNGVGECTKSHPLLLQITVGIYFRLSLSCAECLRSPHRFSVMFRPEDCGAVEVGCRSLCCCSTERPLFTFLFFFVLADCRTFTEEFRPTYIPPSIYYAVPCASHEMLPKKILFFKQNKILWPKG